MRYTVTVWMGESATVYHVVDTAQPEAEQPAVIHSFSTALEPHAEFLARDFCQRHNLKEAGE